METRAGHKYTVEFAYEDMWFAIELLREKVARPAEDSDDEHHELPHFLIMVIREECNRRLAGYTKPDRNWEYQKRFAVICDEIGVGGRD